jgi:hypothetical protein
MTARPPPVPPEQQSDKGPAQSSSSATDNKGEAAHGTSLDPKVGRSGALKQNTKNTGHQQDR